MGIINNVGKSFMDIRDILTLDEKRIVADQWNKGVSKNQTGIDLFLRKNLVECIQPRRHDDKEGFRKTRHMLCTRNFYLARKMIRLRGGKLKVMKKRPKSWYINHKLLLVWDIVANDWRMIDTKQPAKWRLLDFVPISQPKQQQIVLNVWIANFKKIKFPDGGGVRTYCNYIRKGV